MKNKIIKSAFILIVISLTSSCAMHTGYMTSSASLSSNNFKYVKRSVSGKATAVYFLGLGGLHKVAIVEEAKKNLLAENPLQDNQTLANVTVNWKTAIVFFIFSRRCTVTADIVEFK